MTYKHPKALHPGDTVALVSPSGPVPRPEVVDQCRAALENLGFKVRVGASAAKRFDYLAGTDAERTADLNEAFRDRTIRGIFCTRGGYGSGRLLRDLDYAAAANDPKIFAGFSDLTSVHGALLVKSGLAVLHAPTTATALVYQDQLLTPPAHETFVQCVTSTKPLGSIREAMKWNDALVYQKGKAQGILVGGNLSNIAAAIGTPYMPEPSGKILFMEEVGEEPYRVDRFINQLDMSGYLGQLAGIIIGQFTNAEPSDSKREKIETVLPRLVSHLRIPIIANFPTGHVPNNASLPLGCRVEIDADGGDVILKEALCT